ncbi:hypothetical protein [Haladaptatus sp. NG-WS-4]
MKKPNTTLTRRTVLGTVGGLAVAGSGPALLSGSTAAVDTKFTPNNTEVLTTDDGSVREVVVETSGTVSWDGLEEPAGSLSLSLYAKLDADLQYYELAAQRLDAAGLHGRLEYDFEARNLLDDPGFSAADFEAADGTERTRTVWLRLDVTVYGTDGTTTLTTGYADASFTVTVENRDERCEISGEANTGATAPDENGQSDGNVDDGNGDDGDTDSTGDNRGEGE